MRFLLFPFSLLYGLIVTVRNFLFDWNVFKSKSYNIPIICVGNITAGGTGKTPHTEYLLELLSDKKTAVVSRGYGRKSSGLIWVKTESDSEKVGDEPLQIKQKFPNITVVVSENRRLGIENILKKYPKTEVILMDDGFQHRWVKAGLNIILNNYNNPIYSDYLLPYGTLRESENAVKRADVIITTKCAEISPTEKRGIISKLNTCASEHNYFSSIVYQNWKSVFTGKEIDTPNNYNITLVTSVANADNLKHHLQKNGNKITHLSFPDHHNFTTKDIENILSEYNSSISDKNIILTTEKDKVKLLKYKEHFEGVELYFSPIKINIHNSEEFKNEIINYVTKHKRKC
ncbi:MAG: tetraacyldisaccharide 4'-kinase [Flavobacteriales bacterium]|nr:tetraacyldisaccharide 4'-kinase [Flavobacteriales bacterium]MBT7481066.1 tetraacyldisaccharide 4'-kinase [Flavobacteriales bacterium]